MAGIMPATKLGKNDDVCIKGLNRPMSLRFVAGALLAQTMQAIGFAQHYTPTNLVSRASGVAPVTDPQLVNPWSLSRSASSPWWIFRQRDVARDQAELNSAPAQCGD
jgi:hypothetical protein